MRSTIGSPVGPCATGVPPPPPTLQTPDEGSGATCRFSLDDSFVTLPASSQHTVRQFGDMRFRREVVEVTATATEKASRY